MSVQDPGCGNEQENRQAKAHAGKDAGKQGSRKFGDKDDTINTVTLSG